MSLKCCLHQAEKAEKAESDSKCLNSSACVCACVWLNRLRLHSCVDVYAVVYVYVVSLLVLVAAGEVVHVPLGCLMCRLCGSPLCLPLHGGSFCRCPPRSAPAPRPTCPQSPGWSCRSCQSLSLRVKWEKAAERWREERRLGKARVGEQENKSSLGDRNSCSFSSNED